MSYSLIQKSQDEISFEFTKGKLGCVLPFIIIFLLVVVIAFYFLLPSVYYNYLYLGVALVSFGIIMFVLPKKKVKFTFFNSLTINRERQKVTITAGDGTTEIAYGELSHFDVKMTSRSSNSSSGTRHSTNQTTYTYHICLNLKDGSKFSLLSYTNDRTRADDVCNELNEFLGDSSKIPIDYPRGEVPENILHSHLGRKSSYTWQNKNVRGVYQLVYVAAVMLLALFLIGGNFTSVMGGMAWMFIVFAIFFVSILSFILFVNMRMLIQMNKYKFTLEIDQHKVRLFGVSNSGEKEFFSKEYTPVSSFNLFVETTGEINSYDRCLLYKDSEEDKSLSIGKKLKNAVKSLTQNNALYLSNWSMLDVLKFRNELNGKIAQHKDFS